MYDYKKAMADDIREFIKENGLPDGFSMDEPEDLYSMLLDDDSITGNASGSYTMDSRKAMGYVIENLDLLEDALREFGISDKDIAEHFVIGDFEYFDVLIRCYILPEITGDVLNELGIK